MSIEFDKQANALYVRVRQGDVSQTVEFAEDVYLDVDENGDVLGAEFVYADDFFSLLGRLEGRLDIPEHVSV